MLDDESKGERSDSVDNASDTQTIVGDGGVQPDNAQWKLEGIFRALLDQRRRYALYFLQDTKVTNLNELATHVAAMEQDTDPAAVSSDQIEQVQISLVHADLPLLEDRGLVEFDQRSNAVRYARPPDLLEKLLRLCARFDAPEISSQ